MQPGGIYIFKLFKKYIGNLRKSLLYSFYDWLWRRAKFDVSNSILSKHNPWCWHSLYE
jgi:hypothetical protein